MCIMLMTGGDLLMSYAFWIAPVGVKQIELHQILLRFSFFTATLLNCSNFVRNENRLSLAVKRLGILAKDRSSNTRRDGS